MRPVTLRLAAAGYTQWIPVDRIQNSFLTTLGVILSSGAVLTYSVEYTLDDFQNPANLTQQFTLSRTTTTLTVTKTNHGLSVGDWVKLWGNGGAPLDAEFASVASVVDTNNFTLTVADSGLTAGNGTGWLQTARTFDHATLASLSASGSGTISAPVIAVRLRVSAWTSGTVDFNVIQGGP